MNVGGRFCGGGGKIVNLWQISNDMNLSLHRIAAMLAAVACSLSAAADIHWLSTVYDFGAFEETDSLMNAQFRFVNDGPEEMAITSASATCGCTTPRYSVEPVQPGDTAVINVAYDPSGRPGRFEKYVYVRTTATQGREKLVIRGTVVGTPASVSVRYPVDMGWLKLRRGAVMVGKVSKGRSKMEFADGYNMRMDSISPSVTGLPEYMEVTVAPKKVAPGEQVQFNFYFRADRCPDYGIVTDTVMVSPDPLSSVLYPLPVVAIVEEDFSRMSPGQIRNAPEAALSAESLDLGRISGAGPVSGEVELYNRGKDKLLVRRVYSSDPGISVSISRTEVKKGKSAKIKVTYTPQPGADIVNARVSVITNSPANPNITLRVVGQQ